MTQETYQGTYLKHTVNSLANANEIAHVLDAKAVAWQIRTNGVACYVAYATGTDTSDSKIADGQSLGFLPALDSTGTKIGLFIKPGGTSGTIEVLELVGR